MATKSWRKTGKHQLGFGPSFCARSCRFVYAGRKRPRISAHLGESFQLVCRIFSEQLDLNHENLSPPTCTTSTSKGAASSKRKSTPQCHTQRAASALNIKAARPKEDLELITPRGRDIGPIRQPPEETTYICFLLGKWSLPPSCHDGGGLTVTNGHCTGVQV